MKLIVSCSAEDPHQLGDGAGPGGLGLLPGGEEGRGGDQGQGVV